MTDADQDATRRAIATYRDRQFADLVVFVVGLAASTHPEEMRKALASVFSVETVGRGLDYVEEHGKRAMTVAKEAKMIAQQARILLDEVKRGLDETDRRIDQMHARIDDAAKKFARIAPKPSANGTATPKEPIR